MRILMIATGYPPYLFSENLCNGKLALALKANGIEVDVISRTDEGPTYGSEWSEPWDTLKPTAHIIQYPQGNKFQRIADIIYSGLKMNGNFIQGIRWCRRAYEEALELIKKNHYDALMTRSPNDTAHLVGMMIKKRTGIKWIANWNDPAAPIWPDQYKHTYSPKKQKEMMAFTEKLLQMADINTFPSDSLRQHFINHFPFLKEAKTDVIPHIGLLSSLWPPKSERKLHHKLLFLHSGNLSAERNPDNTFQTFRRLIDEDGFHEFEFHIMGNINDYTLELIKKYNLDDFVKCIGSFDYMKALSIMQSYDVLVLLEAQLEKGIFFASKFTDYLQTGLPILAISPSNGFAADTLTNKDGEFLADNTSVESILDSLKNIIERWRNGKLKENASNDLYKNLTPSFIVDHLKSIVSNL